MSRPVAISVLIIGAALGLLPISRAAAKTADCVVQSGGRVVLSGSCRFESEGKDGSFGLASGSGKPLFGEVTNLSVTVTKPGVAQVYGLTTSGVNSRWGEARRSKSDGACWVGDDFQICAR